ncbi:AAA family ATPase [Pelomyxa schiedti]|nr:AAA family ATPase [Pelomyxa schiedti]
MAQPKEDETRSAAPPSHSISAPSAESTASLNPNSTANQPPPEIERNDKTTTPPPVTRIRASSGSQKPEVVPQGTPPRHDDGNNTQQGSTSHTTETTSTQAVSSSPTTALSVNATAGVPEKVPTTKDKDDEPAIPKNQEEWNDEILLVPGNSGSCASGGSNWMDSFSKRLNKLFKALERSFVERDEAIKICMLAVLCRQHVLLFGPPGTGKSAVCIDVCKVIHTEVGKRSFFNIVLHAGTTLDDLVGTIDLEALDRNILVRCKQNKLCGEHTLFAFIDEIFKAQRQVLTVLLPILNERDFFDGTELIHLPLHTVFAASNEVPMDANQGALFDRFLLRVLVCPISNKMTMYSPQLRGRRPEVPEKRHLNFADIVRLHQHMNHSGWAINGGWDAARSPADVSAYGSEVEFLLSELDDYVSSLTKPTEITNAHENVQGGGLLSDRRRKQLSEVLCVVATSCGRNRPHPFDLLLLPYGMWKTQVQHDKIFRFFILKLRLRMRQVNCRRKAEFHILDTHLWIANWVRDEVKKKVTERDSQELSAITKDSENTAIQQTLGADITSNIGVRQGTYDPTKDAIRGNGMNSAVSDGIQTDPYSHVGNRQRQEPIGGQVSTSSTPNTGKIIANSSMGLDERGTSNSREPPLAPLNTRSPSLIHILTTEEKQLCDWLKIQNVDNRQYKMVKRNEQLDLNTAVSFMVGDTFRARTLHDLGYECFALVVGNSLKNPESGSTDIATFLETQCHFKVTCKTNSDWGTWKGTFQDFLGTLPALSDTNKLATIFYFAGHTKQMDSDHCLFLGSEVAVLGNVVDNLAARSHLVIVVIDAFPSNDPLGGQWRGCSGVLVGADVRAPCSLWFGFLWKKPCH